jgi:predicted nuclease of predicted toxin-antitoxin system
VRFLADMNMSPLTVEWLRSRGHHATHVREQDLQRASDDFILDKARSEQSILLTMDLDFGYLMAASREQMPSVILFRLVRDTSDAVNERLSAVLGLDDIDWAAGVFVTVSDATIRVRQLPLRIATPANR